MDNHAELYPQMERIVRAAPDFEAAMSVLYNFVLMNTELSGLAVARVVGGFVIWLGEEEG